MLRISLTSKLVHPLVRTLVLTGLCTLTSVAQAQYKSVGPDGRVTYSDQPPPGDARVVEQRSFGQPPASYTLPPEVQQAVSSAPVTLYTTDKCEPCDRARAFLRGRGVPFTEKYVKTDDEIKLFRAISPDGSIPLATIGARKQTGFEAGAWGAALDVAGYPTEIKLPVNYKDPVPESIAPSAPAQNSSGSDGRPAPIPQALPDSGNAPPGFRF